MMKTAGSRQKRAEGAQTQQLFYALSDPTRRSIVELLAANGQMTATGIYDNFSVSHPAISQHLRVLREAQLLSLEKDAQRRIYSLNPSSMRELQKWVARMTQLWDDRFVRLDAVLEEQKGKAAGRGDA